MAAAVVELEEASMEHASLRSIARRVGMRHQSVAYHFPDRVALFTAVAAAGFTQLFRHSEAALAHMSVDASRGDAIANLGETYIRFARDNRAIFRLMSSSALIDAQAPDLVQAQAQMWTLHLGTVIKAVEQGWGGDASADVLAVASWSAAHGLAVIEADLPGGLPVPTPAEEILHIVTTAIRDSSRPDGAPE